MIDKFADLPDTLQGLGIYTGYALKEMKRYERKINVLKENIEEANRRLGAAKMKEQK